MGLIRKRKDSTRQRRSPPGRDTRAGRHTNDYVSEAEGTVGEFANSDQLESLTDASPRGGPLGAENELPDGGNSTRIPEDQKEKGRKAA